VKTEGNPSILVAHTGIRCPAASAGAVTVQGFAIVNYNLSPPVIQHQTALESSHHLE